jgi:hypothetical protein
MKKPNIPFKAICVLLISCILFVSCSSTTLLTSSPSGAKVYMDGESVGTTPYSHSDTKIVGTTTSLKLVKEGYEPINTVLTRNEKVNVGAIIGGCFFVFPFLWTMNYNPTHNYELVLLGTKQSGTDNNLPQTSTSVKSKFERLKELKALLDDKAITQAEYDIEKKKILDEK